MDNKNEKTFSDLFLNVTDSKDDERVDEQVTFDSLSSDIETSDKEINETNISFGDISNIIGDGENIELVDDSNLGEEVSFNQITNDVFSDVDSDNDKLNDEEVIIDNTENTNNIFNDGNSNVGSSEEFQNYHDVIDETSVIQENGITNNDINEKIVESEEKDNVVDANPFMSDVDTISNDEVEQDNDELINNNLVNEDNVNNFEIEDNVVDVNPFMSDVDAISNDEVEQDNDELINNNLVNVDNANNSEIEDNVVDVNPFMSDVDAIGNDEMEKIVTNSEVEDNAFVNNFNEEVSTKVEEVKVDDSNNFSSPFFDNSNFDDSNNNPLFSNSISLGEVSNTSSNVGKLNLNNTKHFGVKIVPKKEPISKFIIGVISYSFFIWLLLIGITLLVYVLDIKIRAAKGDYSAPTFNAYVVLTGSMLPEIHVNDVVITKRVDAEDLDVGDIITFASADSRFLGTVITHRIIKKNQDKEGNITFQTQGDNNNVADNALVPEANIYGKVILKIPKLGYLQEFLATDGGWIIVILIPCLTVISYDIVKIAKGIKNKKNKNIKMQSR